MTLRCEHCDVALTLHARRAAALPPLRARAAGADALPRVRVGRARAARGRNRAARAGARGAASRSSSCCASTRTRPREPATLAEALAALRRGRPRRAARHADGREGPPLRGRRARGGRRRRHRARRCRTSAPRSGRSSSSPSSPGRSGRDAPGRVLVQTYQPDARPIALAARHAVEEFLAGELERRRELGYPPFRHLVRVRRRGPDRGRPAARARASSRRARGLGDAELLGPAPLLRLRGRFRAQLLAKTGDPRRVAVAARPAPRGGRAGDAPGRADRRGRRRSPERLISDRASLSESKAQVEGRAARRRARGAAPARARAGAPVPGSRCCGWRRARSRRSTTRSARSPSG